MSGRDKWKSRAKTEKLSFFQENCSNFARPGKVYMEVPLRDHKFRYIFKSHNKFKSETLLP